MHDGDGSTITIDEALEHFGRAFDQITDDAIDSAENLMRDHGATDAEIEAEIERTVQEFARQKIDGLQRLRSWLQREGHTLQ